MDDTEPFVERGGGKGKLREDNGGGGGGAEEEVTDPERLGG